MDLIDQLRALPEPVPDDGAAKARAAEKLAQHIQPHRTKRRRLRPALLVAASVAAAVAVGAVLSLGGGSRSVGSASAATVLRQAAANARLHGLSGPIPDGQYYYQRFVEVQGNAPELQHSRAVQEEWISNTGTGRMRTTSATRGISRDDYFPTPYYSPAITHPHTTYWPAHGLWMGYGVGGKAILSYQQMLRLPTDPQTLFRLLGRNPYHAGQSAREEQFDNVTELLIRPALPAALRAGLFRATAMIPGVRLLGHTTINGQPGAILGQPSNGLLSEIIINPATGDLLGLREIMQSAGATTYTATWQASGLVNSEQATAK